MPRAVTVVWNQGGIRLLGLSELGGFFESRSLAVLATHGEGGAYANLIAFAVTNDLKHIVFATPRQTLKYRNIHNNPAVAVLVDSRSNQESDFSQAIAVTAVGRATECIGDDREHLMKVYMHKHPVLGAFVADNNTALMRVAVERYIIAGFRENHVVVPG
ncbi:MAG: pyridoxamine 5'-phosphate oxidase family protein [Dehalococcoidia bacterium]|nr:pyridoxamine 5'-phosphate oxidase family protein [Dehalococcoidia bacterium]